jgi:hypothetical protein
MDEMRKTIDQVSFTIPVGWTVEESTEGEGWTATVQSPGTAFALLAFRPDVEEAAQLADETLAALKDDYPELDQEDRVESLAGRMAIGHDLDFIALDATVTCRTRCLETPGGPLLLMLQSRLREPEHVIEELNTIAGSLEIDND